MLTGVITNQEVLEMNNTAEAKYRDIKGPLAISRYNNVPARRNKNKMINGRFEKYFLRKKFRKLFTAISEIIVIIQARQKSKGFVIQTTLIKNGKTRSRTAILKKSGILFIKG